MSEILVWMNSHIVELQISGLIATGVILVLALILLNRAASELYRSRSQRLKSEQTFQRIQTLLTARENGVSPFESARGSRVSMSGPIVRSARPLSVKSDPKPSPRNEPKVAPFNRLNTRRSMN